MILVSGATATVDRYAGSGCIGRLLRPGNGNRPTALPWAADNGAFTGFDADKFRDFLDRIANASGCMWVAAPDVVADHSATLERFASWEPEMHRAGFPVAFVLQDGADPSSVPWSSCDAVFIGGSTRWKVSEMARGLIMHARRRGKRTHMGRVNTRSRMLIAHQFGVDTIDGTKFSKWPDEWIPWGIRTIRALEQQRPLPLGAA